MCDRPESDSLTTEFSRERSIRRTVKVLEFKRKRIHEELEQLILHLALLIPSIGTSATSNTVSSELLEEAVNRIGDEAFGQLLRQILQEVD
jgi:hypothetical protein